MNIGCIGRNTTKDIIKLIMSNPKEEAGVLEELTVNEMLGITVAPEEELIKWQVQFNESDNTVTLDGYIGTDIVDTIEVYDKYIVEGVEYSTIFKPITTDYVTGDRQPFISDENVMKNVKNIIIHDHVNNKYTKLNYLFYGCEQLQSIDFGTGPKLEITEMQYTFMNCKKIDASLIKNMPDTSNVTNFNQCFYRSSFDPNLVPSFSFKSCESMDGSFSNSILSIIDLTRFEFPNKISAYKMFSNDDNSIDQKIIKLPIMKISKLQNTFTNVQFAEYPDTISNIDISECYNFLNTFNGTDLEIIDLTNWMFSDIGRISANQMFANMPNLKEVKVNNTWNNVTLKNYLFKNSPMISDVTYVD